MRHADALRTAMAGSDDLDRSPRREGSSCGSNGSASCPPALPTPMVFSSPTVSAASPSLGSSTGRISALVALRLRRQNHRAPARRLSAVAAPPRRQQAHQGRDQAPARALPRRHRDMRRGRRRSRRTATWLPSGRALRRRSPLFRLWRISSTSSWPISAGPGGGG